MVGKWGQFKEWLKSSWVHRPYKFITKKIIPLFTLASSIGFWAFILFIAGIHWSHAPISVVSDFQIVLDNPKYESSQTYSNNDSLKITFILSNNWKEPIDAEFNIIKPECIKANITCNVIYQECPKSPDLSKEFMFKHFQGETQYITLEGIFTDCVSDLELCLVVDEPKFKANSESNCVEFSPSQLKR